jgi:hypothetical protein
MNWWEIAIGILAWSLVCAWVGVKYGNRLEADARARLAEFETGAKTMGGAFKKP